VKNAKSSDNFGKIKKKSILTVTAILTAFVLIFLCAFGGTTLYQLDQAKKLKTMSAREMIEYCCSDKSTKISVAVIENGNLSTHIYGSNGEESGLYDYEIGSVSKTFVALLYAKAIAEGKLTLSDSISTYLDLEENKYYPTIERLLTHTSGYEAYYFESGMIGNALAHTNDFYGISKGQILKRVKAATLEDKDYPFNYSNFGISVAGLVLEKVYGDDFTNIVNDYIKNELKLSSTLAAKQSGNLTGYWKWKKEDGYIPAGSIVSNIRDMASYLELYLTDGLPYITATYGKLKELNATPDLNAQFNIRIDGIGMTWILDEVNDIVWHNGATTNFNSYMGFTKDKSKGVIILSNLNANDKISMTVIGAKLLTGGSL
jgi:CubicO group peptidase (beta-lactamase class C family)